MKEGQWREHRNLSRLELFLVSMRRSCMEQTRHNVKHLQLPERLNHYLLCTRLPKRPNVFYMPFCTDMATTVCLQCADLKHRELMLHSQLNLFQFAHPQNRALNQARHLHANSISEIYVTNLLVMLLVTEGDRRHRQPTFKHKLRFSKHKVLAYIVYLFFV